MFVVCHVLLSYYKSTDSLHCEIRARVLTERYSCVVRSFFSLSFARITAINPTQNVTFYSDLNNNNITGTQGI